MAVTDAQVRQAVKGLIAAEYPSAQIYAWNALSHVLKDWPGQFRIDDDTVHGWIIKRVGTESTWKNARRDRPFWIYDIWGFYLFRTGKESDNSDDEFSEILETVYQALKDNPRLGIDDEIEEHELLQYELISTIDCGEETLHFAKGKLKVRLCC